jgi:hypothetical protein
MSKDFICKMVKRQILDLMQFWENVGCEGIVVGNGGLSGTVSSGYPIWWV